MKISRILQDTFSIPQRRINAAPPPGESARQTFQQRQAWHQASFGRIAKTQPLGAGGLGMARLPKAGISHSVKKQQAHFGAARWARPRQAIGIHPFATFRRYEQRSLHQNEQKNHWHSSSAAESCSSHPHRIAPQWHPEKARAANHAPHSGKATMDSKHRSRANGSHFLATLHSTPRRAATPCRLILQS